MSDFITSYVDDILAVAEGTEDHPSHEGGAYTAAYGITEAARNRYPKKEGESARDYAVRVAKEYAKEAEKEIGSSAWNKLPGYMKVVALDVHYNSGLSINPTFERNLQEGKYATALKNTLDIISANDKAQNNTKATMPGLAKRRASIYNFAAREMFLPEIKSVVTSPKEGGGVRTKYLTEKGNEVFTQDTRKLHTRASFGTLTPDQYDYTKPLAAEKESKTQQAYNLNDYSVRPGDTLTKIANTLGVDVEDLRHFNESVANTDYIVPNQILKAPDQRGARKLDKPSLDPFEDDQEDLVPLGA